MLTLLLLLSLFFLFYILTGGKLPDVTSNREMVLRYVFSGAGAVTFFIVALVLFQTPVTALIWGFLGWHVPGWVIKSLEGKKQTRLKNMAKDFVASAAGLYAVGQTSSDVVRVMADRLPEPFAADFKEMIAARNMSPHASYPVMFNKLAAKYNLSEFEAVSAILAASERAGGPVSASKGLKRLGHALRQRDRLLAERAKATMEPKIAAFVVIFILLAGLLADATLFRPLFEGPGKVVMAASSALLVGLIFMVRSIVRSDDLA
ncbi:Type II secretion system F domain protein [Desulfofundulus kuznetsovii DSM 6115]|uniref:Type II secretion system F domain protein n=1 Tax=Desulfofundulus kuznetsovii (strain DSM 6115 / VKM B-1805 / 17) TaxID=760568 RepID=A0AAU8PX70_DESK7|nr:Type II secretion system F domain protein [Desulfofundulus kuznetsovii DSM 6115]